jgi:hypothetical protein
MKEKFMNHWSVSLLAGMVLFGLSAVAAPTWPPANLTYFNSAAAQTEVIETAAQAGFSAFGKQDAKAVSSAIVDLQEAGRYFTDNKAPAALAPLAVAAAYSAETCASTLEYFAKLPDESATSPFTLPTLLVMRSDCTDAVQAARMESARAVAAVGAWPNAK